MKKLSHHAKRVCVLFTFLLIISDLSYAGGYNSYGKQSIGIRLGWSGAPNGLTYRKVFSYNQAFELVLGYSGKEGRILDVPQYKKGNTFAGITYAPFLTMSDGRDLSVLLNLNLGTRLRYHNYRPVSAEGAWKVTPDFFGGAGMQVDIGGVELFADLGIKYYNRIDNNFTWAMESGLGMRIALN